jgi:hypothetical protein
MNPIAIQVRTRVVEGEYAEDGSPLVEEEEVLISGRHRLEALIRLGDEYTAVTRLPDAWNADRCKLWQLSENLARSELSALDRDRAIAEYIETAQRVDATAAEKVAQVAQVSGKARGGRGKKGGDSAASRELRIGRDDVRRAQKVASLTPAAQQAARELGLADNRRALLHAAHEEPEQQTETLQKIAAEKAAKKSEPRAPGSVIHVHEPGPGTRPVVLTVQSNSMPTVAEAHREPAPDPEPEPAREVSTGSKAIARWITDHANADNLPVIAGWLEAGNAQDIAELLRAKISDPTVH